MTPLFPPHITRGDVGRLLMTVFRLSSVVLPGCCQLGQVRGSTAEFGNGDEVMFAAPVTHDNKISGDTELCSAVGLNHGFK